ncbi:hypothetical protein [Nocardia otitidiscaviarum]|uniref:hypothetical protein n=1 Tax=Nocardia otitidiscaviarum TaxID=1823 RepID=UPI000AA3FC77|nr:hypothetical protein [Nocardia otitidiscaviarum]
MPVGVNILIDGPTAEVEVLDPQLRRQVAARLVAAARPRAWLVDTVTVGRPVPTFRAPVEIVDAAGLIDHPAEQRHEQHVHFAEGGLISAGSAAANTSAQPEPVISVPPRTGRGSGIDAWQRFLTMVGIDWEPTDSRADLIARWDNHSRRT